MTASTDKQQFLLNIRGEDPKTAPAPMYSNFVSISRLGSDVQLEFVFVDLNELALLVNKMKESGAYEPQNITGKTVTKIVMPGINFMQLKSHLDGLFSALHTELNIPENSDELLNARSKIR